MRAALRPVVLALSFLLWAPAACVRALAQVLGDPAAGQARDGAERVVIHLPGSRDISFGKPVTWLVIADPEIASAEVKPDGGVTCTANAEGETILMVAGAGWRENLAVEVRRKPAPSAEGAAVKALRRGREVAPAAGSIFASFAPAFGGGPFVMRQGFNFTRKLSADRTLRFGSEVYKAFGADAPARAAAASVGLDSLSLGVDSAAGKVDFLDSTIEISPLSFNGFLIRGPHLVTAPGSRLRGAEFFAGLARPSRTLFDHRGGYLAGAVTPIAGGGKWLLRAGLFAIVSDERKESPRGGMALHADWRYATDMGTAAEAEASYGNGALSWRARLGVRRGPFNIYGETLRLDRRTPLAGVGAQAGGRSNDALGVWWLPAPRFGVFINYGKTSNELRRGAARTSLGGTTFSASGHYEPAGWGRFGLRYTRQSVRTNVTGNHSNLHLTTRSIGFSHNARVGEHWSNDLDVVLTTSGEGGAGTAVEEGFSLREEFRRTWGRWATTGHVNYTRNTPTLAGVVVRSPQLLPELLRRAFEEDPVGFLLASGDTLGRLLPGIDLPRTRALDAGLRLQGTVSKYTIAGEARYVGGEFLSLNRRYVQGSLTAGVRLDAANSVRVSASRAFGIELAGGQTQLAVSYTHRFGGDGGLQFPRLLGLDRGRVRGRVFYDLDSDGKEDAGEPGVPGVTVHLEGRRVTSNAQGFYRFDRVAPGEYDVSLSSSDLGSLVRASTSAEQRVLVSARRAVEVNFGLVNYGFVAGRVFNDLSLSGREAAGAPGVSGVRISLRRAGSGPGDRAIWRGVDAAGQYSFRDVAPGNYVLELDPATLPENFRLPDKTSWHLAVTPLHGYYLDIPLAAQRAVSGIVFLDRDGNGAFDPQEDEAVPGASVRAGNSETISGANGAYFLRGLPAGKVEVLARPRAGVEGSTVSLELDKAPTIRRGVNIPISP